MRTYIDKQIIIRKENFTDDHIPLEETWEEITAPMQHFNDDYCIWNTVNENTITIKEQKISLKEKEMSEVLWHFKEICELELDFDIEPDRVICTINDKPQTKIYWREMPDEDDGTWDLCGELGNLSIDICRRDSTGTWSILINNRRFEKSIEGRDNAKTKAEELVKQIQKDPIFTNWL